jgi:hypothetical protein
MISWGFCTFSNSVREYHVKRLIGQAGCGRVPLDELDRHVVLLSEVATVLDHPRLTVKTDHATVCTDALGQ